MISRLLDYLNVGDPTWAVRRRITIGITVFSCGVIVWALGYEENRDFANRVIDHMTYLLLSINVLYVGGSITDDNIKRKLNGGAKPPVVDDKREAL